MHTVEHNRTRSHSVQYNSVAVASSTTSCESYLHDCCGSTPRCDGSWCACCCPQVLLAAVAVSTQKLLQAVMEKRGATFSLQQHVTRLSAHRVKYCRPSTNQVLTSSTLVGTFLSSLGYLCTCKLHRQVHPVHQQPSARESNINNDNHNTDIPRKRLLDKPPTLSNGIMLCVDVMRPIHAVMKSLCCCCCAARSISL